jgi:predicted neuraminidase
MQHRDQSNDAILHSPDVLVAGGGMAGAFAALAAARGGARVLLVEPHNVLGGQATAGLVTGFCGDTARVNRPFADLLAALAESGAVAAYSPHADHRAFDPEWLAFRLQEQLLARKVAILYHALAFDAAAQDGRVHTVRLATVSGEIVCRPRFVVDATGECLLAVRAGFPTDHEPALRQLPMSLCFTLVETAEPVRPFLPQGCPTWDGDEALPMLTLYPRGKAITAKMKVIGFDAADAASLSAAEAHARRQMLGMVYHLQTRGYRGVRYDRYTLLAAPQNIGIREGRRLVGEHVLTEAEVSRGAIFEDAVAVGTYHLDFHWPDKLSRAGTGITRMVPPYHIPLRALVPKGARNILVPGRGASGDQMAMSSFRVMATCAQMGLAAGEAAAQCLARNTDLPSIHVADLQHTLREQGQSLDLSHYGDYLRSHMMIREFVFEDDRPFQQCHASTLVQLSNRRILAAWFGGTHERHPDVGIWVADRSESTWSVPRLAIKINNLPHWNPVLFRAPNGDVLLFFKVGPNCMDWQTWVAVSTDDGKTWSPPRELVPGADRARGPVKNKLIVLADGAWLAPNSIETPESWDVFTERSEDNGQTWTASDLVPRVREGWQGKGVIQPTLWESQPGRVHMLMRSTCGAICRSDSNDGGRTWSRLYPTALPNNNSGLDLACLADGVLALVYNHVAGGIGAPRTPLSLALSFDNGQTWPRRLDLETQPGEYSYPAIIPTVSGMAITYTWKRERIVFWAGSLEQVPPAPQV